MTIYNSYLQITYMFIYPTTCTLCHLLEFSRSFFIIHSTFYITVALSHFSIQSLFSCYMVLITMSIILSHLVSCLHIPRSGYGYKLYVPEGTITVRDSDHILYETVIIYCIDPNGATVMTLMGSTISCDP